MLLLDLAKCGPSGVLKVVYFFKLILDFLFILIPIVLIVLLTIDISKAVISGDEGTQKKAIKLGSKRLLYAIIVFCVPYIVSLVNLVLGDLGVDYSACYYDITLDAIKQLEADEKAEEEAKKAARIEKLKKEQARAKEEAGVQTIINSSDTYLASGSGCDGYVYYENGTFYLPSDSSINGKAGSKGTAPFGYNKYFYAMLSKMIADGHKAGHTIIASSSQYGAWRPYEKQLYFYNCYKTKSCNNGNLAAKPGKSKHGWGIASDLEYNNNNNAIKWAHANAHRYGLKFTVSSENWHIEPASQKTNDSVVKQCK